MPNRNQLPGLHMLARLFLVMGFTLAILGCGVEACPPKATPGIILTTYDADTGNPLCGVNVELSSLLSSNSDVTPNPQDCTDSTYGIAINTIGRVQITLTKEGYNTWVSDDIVIEGENRCEPIAEILDVYLEPSD